MSADSLYLCPYCGRDCSFLGTPPCVHFVGVQWGNTFRHTELSEKLETLADQRATTFPDSLLQEPFVSIVRSIEGGFRERAFYTEDPQRLEKWLRESG